DEAIRDLSHFLAEKKDHGWTWILRGECYVKQGKWREASDDFAQAFELLPNHTMAGWWSALLRLQAGDQEGYRTRCALLLERGLKGANRQQATNLLWACVVGPGAVDNLGPLVQRMEKAVRVLPGMYANLNTLGAALYRAGHYEDAVRRLNEAITIHGKG